MKQTETLTGFTPGPWAVDCSGPCRLAIIGPNREPVALCNMQNEDGDIDEANARLIAAAPDLLEACKLAEGHYLPTPILIAIRNAITKATKA